MRGEKSTDVISWQKQNQDYRLQLNLHSNEKEQGLSIVAQGLGASASQFVLRLEAADINRSPLLVKVFVSPEEIFKEIINQFEQLHFAEQGDSLEISFEVRMGSFRTERVVLKARSVALREETNFSWSGSEKEEPQRVLIDPAFVKDYSLFKAALVEGCEKVHDDPLARRTAEQQGCTRNSVKNLFVALANRVLKTYREAVATRSGSGSDDRAPFIEFEEENPLLAQKNALLHNTLRKVTERARRQAPPDLELDFSLSPPSGLRLLPLDPAAAPEALRLPQPEQPGSVGQLPHLEARLRALEEVRSRTARACEELLAQGRRLVECEDWWQARGGVEGPGKQFAGGF